MVLDGYWWFLTVYHMWFLWVFAADMLKQTRVHWPEFRWFKWWSWRNNWNSLGETTGICLEKQLPFTWVNSWNSLGETTGIHLGKQVELTWQKKQNSLYRRNNFILTHMNAKVLTCRKNTAKLQLLPVSWMLPRALDEKMLRHLTVSPRSYSCFAEVWWK